ncbi:MAG: citrate lyase holo-[acyl-carrier protein] synthase [Bacillota bacterium]|nr:citrate lyase holo-[acyl-carrier protein] synthase [Bacillota bacterium]
MNNTIEDVQNDKERRKRFQKYLIDKYNMTLLVMTPNYPGIYKTNYLTEAIIEAMDHALIDIFADEVQLKIYRITLEGPTSIMLIDKDAQMIKRITIDIERKHILGKCVNIAVYDNWGDRVNRTDLGYNSRECSICGGNFDECNASKRHSEAEIIRFIRENYVKYMKYAEKHYGTK